MTLVAVYLGFIFIVTIFCLYSYGRYGLQACRRKIGLGTVKPEDDLDAAYIAMLVLWPATLAGAIVYQVMLLPVRLGRLNRPSEVASARARYVEKV